VPGFFWECNVSVLRIVVIKKVEAIFKKAEDRKKASGLDGIIYYG
jgi:hypothetical protein